MDWNKFKNLFGDWSDRIKSFFDEGGFEEIYNTLKEQGKTRKIAPLSHLTYRCFQETSIKDVKVVMMGQAPYNSLRNGEIVADGLLMGCSLTDHIQPSLSQFYQGVEDELYDGLRLDLYKGPDLTYLAKQGVLMWNASLTTLIGEAGSHMELWQPFTKYVIEEILNTMGIPFILLGREAQNFEGIIHERNRVFSLSHPASASYKKEQWSSGQTFTEVNKIIKDNNNFEIEWIDKLPF